MSTYPVLKSSQQFAIISPYAAQVNLFKERFKNTFGVESEKVVDITTVDGCQVKRLILFWVKSFAFTRRENSGSIFIRKSMKYVGLKTAGCLFLGI